MLKNVTAMAPADRAGAGGGKAAADDRHHGGGSGRMIGHGTGRVLHPDPPPAARRVAACRDVPAQADEHAAAKPGGDPGSSPVRGPGLRRGAEVEPGAGRDAEQAVFLVQADLPPAADDRDERRRRCPRLPGAGQRVHVAAGLPGRPQGSADRLREQRADLDRAVLAGGCVDGKKLGVTAEGAAGRVHRGKLGRQQAAGLRQRGRVGDGQRGQGPQRWPLGCGRHWPGRGSGR